MWTRAVDRIQRQGLPTRFIDRFENQVHQLGLWTGSGTGSPTRFMDHVRGPCSPTAFTNQVYGLFTNQVHGPHSGTMFANHICQSFSWTRFPNQVHGPYSPIRLMDQVYQLGSPTSLPIRFMSYPNLAPELVSAFSL